MMVQQQWRPENDRAVAAGAVGAHHEQWCVGTNQAAAGGSSCPLAARETYCRALFWQQEFA